MAKCMKKGCEESREEDSNYCVAHTPGKMMHKKVLKHSPAREGTKSSINPPGGRPGPRPPPK